MQPLVGQRYRFNNRGTTTYVAEVVKADTLLQCRIVQMIKPPADADPEIVLGSTITPTTLTLDGPRISESGWQNWTLMDGQELPG